MDDKPSTHCRLQHVDETSWVLIDDETVVAHIQLADEEALEVASVRWVDAVPLRARYATPEHVLADYEVWAHRAARDTKPVPIPHLHPPLTERASL